MNKKSRGHQYSIFFGEEIEKEEKLGALGFDWNWPKTLYFTVVVETFIRHANYALSLIKPLQFVVSPMINLYWATFWHFSCVVACLCAFGKGGQMHFRQRSFALRLLVCVVDVDRFTS